MKRNSERCMALVLALMMILSLFPVGAFAEGDGSLPVHFICDETTASVTVYDAGGQPVAVGADGVHHLTPGTYSYSATAEGYESTGMQTFMVPEGAVGDQELRLSLTPVTVGEQPADAPEQIPQGDSAPKQDPQNETEPSPTPQIEDDGKLRIYPADGSFHLTIDGEYTTAAAVPAELQEAVGGKDKEAAKPGAENADTPAPGLYLKQPAAEELYLDRLAVEKAIGYFTTDWTVVNLVDEEGERKGMTGSYDVIVSGPAMDKYASARPVFALLTLHWDEEGDIVDRDVSIIEPNVTPSGSSWSFRTDTLSTLVIATPTGNPYVEENTKDETKQPEGTPAPETEQPAETPKEKKYRELAEELTEMAVSGAYFYEIKNKLDRQIKDRDAALAFLDAEERLMREIMLEGNAPLMDRSKALACVGYIEEARRDILGNVRQVYAVRNLLLKIGG